MTSKIRAIDQARLNSATKYPSIETYHTLDPANGRLREPAMPFTGTVTLTEKINGTSGRIIILPDGDWFIGSREELLYAAGDRVENPALGIVRTLLPLARRIGQLSRSFSARQGITWVFFLEVYGHGITGAAKQYTTTPGVTGYRLFDIAGVDAEVLNWEREKISSWRQHGGQQFLSEAVLQAAAEAEEIPLVPRLSTVDAAELPQGLKEMQDFLRETLSGGTGAVLDASGSGAAEGLVLRSADRSVIAKARFEDYARTLDRQQDKKGRSMPGVSPWPKGVKRS
jgi:hypothetical protein